MKRSIALLFLLLLPGTPLLANQDGIIVRSATLYAGASRGSERVGRIDAGTPVTIFGRKGGWQEIFSEEKALIGWVRTYEVREVESDLPPQTEARSDSRGFLAGLASFSRKASRFFGGGNSNAGSGTATIGVRGLSEADLKSAQPDLQELERMRGFASDASRSARFGRDGDLRRHKIGHLKPRSEDDHGGGSGRSK